MGNRPWKDVVTHRIEDKCAAQQVPGQSQRQIYFQVAYFQIGGHESLFIPVKKAGDGPMLQVDITLCGSDDRLHCV